MEHKISILTKSTDPDSHLEGAFFKFYGEDPDEGLPPAIREEDLVAASSAAPGPIGDNNT